MIRAAGLSTSSPPSAILRSEKKNSLPGAGEIHHHYDG